MNRQTVSAIRAVLAMGILLALSVPTMGSDRKYGFTAESDAELLSKVREPEVSAVILGCVYKYVPPAEKKSTAHTSYVTVIESYKGKLTVGEKAVVVIYAEEGPAEAQELGALRFYLLRAPSSEKEGPPGHFFCDWTECLYYPLYGEPLRQLLRKQNKSRK